MIDGRPEIYLAGPEVFLPDPPARAAEMKAVCARLGAVGRFPMDNQGDVADPDPDVMAAKICRADEALVASCDAVVANMTPFRGPSMDAGTCYEMGLAKGLGKFVVGWTGDRRRWHEKVALIAPLVREGDWFRDAEGMLCRDFGLIDNLMMVKGAHAVTDSFEAAVAHVVAHFRGARMIRQTTAEATVAALLAHGIDTLYALPGVHNDFLFDAIAQSGGAMRVLHPRHEQTAGYMALGAALATGRAQACAMVPGPGVLNASAALLTAYGTGAPVLALAGQIPSDAIDKGWGHLHELPDQLGLLRHFCKFVARIGGAADAPGLVAEAVRQALSGRTRPVALECAIDTWGRSGAAVPVAPLAPERPGVDPDAVASAAALLDKAERPLILAGGGALDAATELRALAERLGTPVVTYRRGRGVLPTTHPLAVSLPVGHRLWRDADVVLGVGTRMHFAQSVWGTDPAMKIIRLDIDAEEHNRFRRPDVALHGDAREGVAALLAALPGRARPARPEVAAAQAWFAERLSRQEPQMGFLHAIRAALPDDGVVVEDVTQVGFVGRLAFEVAAPRRYISPGYQDNLGWGYGTALGVQAALPDRAVVAICGDGGFMYQAAELATAMRHNIPAVVIVFDDGVFGNVKRIQQQMFGNRLIAYDLANPDFVAFARSFGMNAWKATDPGELQDALSAALGARAPGLIHVPVSEMPSPWDMLVSPRVRGFEEAWRPALP